MDDKPTPKPWWQWLLMYPTLVVSLIAALPNLRDVAVAVSRGITLERAVDGRLQSEMWERNIACLSQPNFERKTVAEKFEVGAAVCPTGDVLLHIRSPKAKEFYRWIPFQPAPSDRAKLAALLISSAYADDRSSIVLAQTDSVVICQRSMSGAQILRRIRIGSGCYDEFIDAMSGRLLRRVPASCETSCN